MFHTQNKLESMQNQVKLELTQERGKEFHRCSSQRGQQGFSVLDHWRR